MRTEGSYLPGVFEEVVCTEYARTLTPKNALHVKASDNYTDQFGKKRCVLRVVWGREGREGEWRWKGGVGREQSGKDGGGVGKVLCHGCVLLCCGCAEKLEMSGWSHPKTPPLTSQL